MAGCNLEDNSIFVVNAYTPPSRPVPLERFGFSYAGVAIAFDACQQLVDAANRLLVSALPREILFPSTVMPQFFHVFSSVPIFAWCR